MTRALSDESFGSTCGSACGSAEPPAEPTAWRASAAACAATSLWREAATSSAGDQTTVALAAGSGEALGAPKGSPPAGVCGATFARPDSRRKSGGALAAGETVGASVGSSVGGGE
ncbi:unnamed protein product [Prorocentrum cordatum]|uniref:Uncharacterized protein n=1 Tax=Prorocentrum cordatum TaxID=2364126 RepID=A0ABN9Y3A3_9DINO|nr:unnamed protein product [Polarella glacialis]